MQVNRFAVVAVIVTACGSSSVQTAAPQTPVRPPSIDVAGTPTMAVPNTAQPSLTLSAPPTRTATALATPTATALATPTAKPVSSPKTGPGYDQLENVDPAAVTIVPVPQGTRVGIPAFCAHQAAYNDFDSTVENLLDFQTGAVTTIAGPGQGVKFANPVISPNWIVWVSWRQKIDPNSALASEPLHWVISAVPTADATSAPIEVASGTNVEPPAPDRPTLAIDGDLLAYTVESAQGGHPQANAVIIHDLATGVDVERIQTEKSVWALDLSGPNVVYSEGTVDNHGFVNDTRVMLAVGNAPAEQIAQYGYEVAIDGDRLVWAQAASGSESGLAIDQAIMTATLSALEPLQLSRQSTDVQPYSGYWPAAGQNLVSWDDRAGGKLDDHVEVWDAISGKTVPIFQPSTYTISGICGGSIGWHGAVESPPGNLFDAFYNVPVDAVKRLFE